MDFKIFVEEAAFVTHLEPLESAGVSKRAKLKFISSICSNCVKFRYYSPIHLFPSDFQSFAIKGRRCNADVLWLKNNKRLQIDDYTRNIKLT